MTKAAFNKKNALLYREIGLIFKNKVVKGYIWTTALHGAESWTLRQVHQSTLKGLKCGARDAHRR
jgi:hypothetical protein